MYDLLLTLLLVMSAVIVIAIFMQPQKNPTSNVFDGGGSEALFERSKPRGFEAFMQRFTGIMVFLWMLDALVLAIISSK
ncbi:preprotein translocase subunit SecG [Streptococcus dentiloxodontae]